MRQLARRNSCSHQQSNNVQVSPFFSNQLQNCLSTPAPPDLKRLETLTNRRFACPLSDKREHVAKNANVLALI
jgi:hypothetical protein